MNKMRLTHVLVFATAIAGTVAMWAWTHDGLRPASGAPGTDRPTNHPWIQRDVPGTPALPASSPLATVHTSGDAMPRSALEGTRYPTLRVGKDGSLVLDQAVQENLERLIALNDRAELKQKLNDMARSLPPAAARQLSDLLMQYAQYESALQQEFVQNEAPQNMQEALQQLDATHAVRVRHFGEATAKALFADDEEAARSILNLTRQQDEPGLSFEQRIELAQQVYAKLMAARSAPH